MNRLFGSISLPVAALVAAALAGCVLAHDLVSVHPFISVAEAAPAGDVARGRSIVAANCAFCHGLTAGAVMVGPSLWGVAGRKIASVPGFDYSGALEAHGADSWTDAQLDAWLTNPAKYAPGTKMYYPGLADAKSRTDVIAFLHTLGPAH